MSFVGCLLILISLFDVDYQDNIVFHESSEFPVRLENPHVISPDQIWVGVVPVGPSGQALNSSYRTRETIQYKQELGTAIGRPIVTKYSCFYSDITLLTYLLILQ